MTAARYVLGHRCGVCGKLAQDCSRMPDMTDATPLRGTLELCETPPAGGTGCICAGCTAKAAAGWAAAASGR